MTSGARSRTTPSDPTNGRAVTLADHDEIERLHAELAELRASRARLVRAADADRRSIERELHGGVQQHLVALAMRLQLAESALDSDPAAAKALLEEIGRDVQDAIDEAAQPRATDLPAAARARPRRRASRRLGERRRLGLGRGRPAGSSWPPEILHTVYACWLEALAQPGDARPAIAVREDASALVVRGRPWRRPRSTAQLDALRDRVEALGGALTVRAEPGGGVRVSGSLPLSR